MTATLLFDLDDTLLQNSMSSFLPVYLGGLSDHLGSFKLDFDIQRAVLEGTQYMIRNMDPAITLEESFDTYFYPRLGVEKKDLQKDINHFYQNIFPEFAYITKPIAAAQSLIAKLAKNDVNLVIATNPLFPLPAVLYRLNWADLGADPQRFSLITSYEQFHFAKPNPAYYAEILAHLGWPEGPIAMIGNDWELDILPAEIIGLPTFFLGKPPEGDLSSRHRLSSQGGWNELNNWIDERISEKDTFDLNVSKPAITAILSATAAYLDSLRRQFEAINFWNTRPEPDEWSLVEIISHIADVDAEVNLPRIKILENQVFPFFAAIETDHWAQERNYIENDACQQMEKFIANRKILINEFSSLSEEEMAKPIQHAIFGPTSVLEIFKFIAHHDRIHITQISKIIASLRPKESENQIE